jgi:hypothetical protein
MTWLLKIEFVTKEGLDEWVERTDHETGKDTCIIDVEYEELEED